MTRTAYQTDLTDIEWAILEPLIPDAKSGRRPRDTDMREVLNAIFLCRPRRLRMASVTQ